MHASIRQGSSRTWCGSGGLLYSNPALQVSNRLLHSNTKTLPGLVLGKPCLKRDDPVTANIFVIALPKEDDKALVLSKGAQLAALPRVWSRHLLKPCVRMLAEALCMQ